MATPNIPLTFPLAGKLARPLNTMRQWPDASGGGGVACLRPLDPTALAGFGFSAPTMSGSDQIASAAIPGGTSLFGAVGAAIDLSAGKHCYRLNVTALRLAAVGEGILSAFINMYDSTPTVQIGVGVMSQNGAYTLVAIAGGVGQTPIALGTTLPAGIKVTVDSGAATFSLYSVSDVLLGGPYSFTAGTLSPVLGMDGNGAAGAVVGGLTTAAFVTSWSGIGTSPVAGYLDLCGNTAP